MNVDRFTLWYKEFPFLLQNCWFFSHKTRLTRASPSDLVQVPSKNVWLESPVSLHYVGMTDWQRPLQTHYLSSSLHINISKVNFPFL